VGIPSDDFFEMVLSSPDDETLVQKMKAHLRQKGE
jgi:hypothetical protein